MWSRRGTGAWAWAAIVVFACAQYVELVPPWDARGWERGRESSSARYIPSSTTSAPLVR